MGKNQKRRVGQKRAKNKQASSSDLPPPRWWNRTLDANAVIAFGTVGLIIVGIVGIYFANRQFAESHRPRIVFSRPMELGGAVTCDMAQHFPKSGAEVTGDFPGPVVWLKNIGSSDATKVFDTFMMDSPKLVALKKTGNPRLDGRPKIDDSTCQNISQDPRFMAFPIYAGQEYKFDSMRGATIGSKPALPKDTLVELVWSWCFGYWDEDGGRHATCTTYIFQPSDSKGSFFTCGHPITGTFELAMTGHCES